MKRFANLKCVSILLVVAFALLITAFLGCSKKSKQKEIKLGATFPLTGDVASYGQKAKRGIELATTEINSKGGLLGKPVNVDFQDDRGDSKEAINIMMRFATIDKIPVVFGSAGSTVTLAITPIASKNQVILISPISSSSKLSNEGGHYFFRTCPADDLQSEILSNWVAGSGVKNVAVVYTNNSWGKPLAEGFKEKFQKSGGRVLANEGVEESSTDFRTIIAKLQNIKGLEAIVSPTYPKEGGVFVRQLKEIGLGLPLFGGDNWGSPEFIDVAKEAAEGVFYTAPSEGNSPVYKYFAQRYRQKYGEEPDVFSAYAYDAALAIFKAIQNCNSTKPEAIREELLRISFVGASGTISFKPNGDLKSEAFTKKTIKDGKTVNLK
ncbi:MAG: ABC transporter substrate-binding protein [Sedimentisphaerales bacterium]